MLSNSIYRVFLTLLSLFLLTKETLAQSTTPFSNSSSTGASVTSAAASTSTAPDVYLNVPTLSVGRIELDVDDLRADINLNAQVASLVTLNAGVALSIQQVNLTIVDVDAELELIVRLGHLVDIVSRVFQSLDLNPLLISTLNNVTSLLEPIVGAVDGLLGSITQGGTTLSFLIDNLGNIVQEVGGVSSIVGNYLTNMTDTGVSQSLSGGLTEKTFSYTPLNALVDIVFNAAGQVVQATVQKTTGGSTSTTTSAATTTPAATTTTTTTPTTAATSRRH
ncbi:hypothetical protein LTR67_002339 [Exophiala xenobiotica]|nr:hypothetical protein H2202_004400 [Exophiala xenobiotica]KAK5211292.1 hypothetical protein LTR41_002752 [Exophiala xenobiotica]KAK5229093.1 hypothetical protein LTR47_007984 [Exophiala xenobiotica]KAK5253013.1 hypothetical protein LTS06_002471 [Exophiala xenobiotica]KAK5283602.1 hypothetical protein LTR40_001507 [Exophiala xenobiotica]